MLWKFHHDAGVTPVEPMTSASPVLLFTLSRKREKKAADRIFGLLPEDQAAELRGLFEEFEERSTPEARFARTMDNFQPILLNDSNGGSDWREHGVCLSQVLGRHKRNGEGSQVIGDYILDLIGDNVRKGNIKDR